MRGQLVGTGSLLLVLASGALGGLVHAYRRVTAAAPSVATPEVAKAALMTLVALVLFAAIAGSVVGGVLCRPLLGGDRRSRSGSRR